MISVRLYGGLGNQMFQMAAAIAASLKYNIPYCIPKHTLNNEVWKPYFFGNVNYCGESVRTACIYNEKSHAYSEIPKPHCNYYVLNGYFQSELYFKDYLPEIRKAFGFDGLEIKKDTCSIHVRRADYLEHPTKHPVVDSYYLVNAISAIFNKTNCTSFLVFGDDSEWNKNYFRNISAYGDNGKVCDMNFTFSENKDAVQDLKLMASCEHNIIANSTFSWWAAYLNNNSNKLVVTPDEENWFGIDNKHLDVSTLLPKGWIRIKY